MPVLHGVITFVSCRCGHCKRLAPEYERAAKQLIELATPIKLAKVDASVEKLLAKKFDVSGYPALLVFRRGKYAQYGGPREERGIVEYMRAMQTPPSKEISSLSELKRSSSPDYPTVVGLFENDHDPLFEIFTDAANAQRDLTYMFLHTFEEKVIKELKEKVGNVLLVQPERFQSQFEPLHPSSTTH